MASISGIDLQVHNDFLAGSAFSLSRNSRVDADIPVNDNRILLCQNKPFVIVLLTSISSEEEVLSQAYQVAQCGLDIISIQGLDDLTIPDAIEESITWWQQNGEINLQIVNTVVTSISISTGQPSLVNPDGSITEIALPPLPAWHPAFRYFRLSQTTDDLFDSYRNLYLTFEAILSSRIPKGKSGERAWLKRALQEVAKDCDLSLYVHKQATDSIQEIITEQYEAHRCSLFHAKEASTSILPGSLAVRSQVASAHYHLSRLIVDLSRRYLFSWSQGGGGGFTPFAFSQVIKTLSDSLKIVVTESNAPTREETSQYRQEATFFELDTVYTGLSRRSDFEHNFVGKVSTPNLPPVINCAASYMDSNDLLSYSSIDSLTLEDVDTLLIQSNFILVNKGPKSRFQL